MYIKRLLICCVLMASSAALFAQSGADSLQGEWEIGKAVVKVYAQQGGALLAESTITDQSLIKQIKPVVLLNLLFTGQQYVAQYQLNMENGTFSAANNVLQLQRNIDGVPPTILRYQQITGGQLQITLPQTYYRDTERNQSVKQSVICFFHKKLQP